MPAKKKTSKPNPPQPAEPPASSTEKAPDPAAELVQLSRALLAKMQEVQLKAVATTPQAFDTFDVVLAWDVQIHVTGRAPIRVHGHTLMGELLSPELLPSALRRINDVLSGQVCSAVSIKTQRLVTELAAPPSDEDHFSLPPERILGQHDDAGEDPEVLPPESELPARPPA